MTHHTDIERAEFEEFASVNGERPELVARNQAGEYLRLDTATGWMWWQAARRAPAVPVPQETCVICGSNEPYTGTCGSNDPRALCKKPAPQPPEAAQLDDIGVVDMAQAVDSKEAAPVQLPEYDIDTANHAGIRVRGYTQETVRQLLADQQFKLDELAMLTRMVVHAFRQVAPDNKTAAKAVDYLKRKGLAGNPLRAAQEQST